MRKVILRDHYRVPPFNEYARDLRILNKVLWLYQRDVLSRHSATPLRSSSRPQRWYSPPVAGRLAPHPSTSRSLRPLHFRDFAALYTLLPPRPCLPRLRCKTPLRTALPGK
jgi:hypothetical protein